MSRIYRTVRSARRRRSGATRPRSDSVERMENRSDAELNSLRARAYGPDADITGDPAALARLAQLEASAKPRSSVAVPAPAEADLPSAAASTDPGTPDAAAPTTPVASARPRRRGVILALAWAASLVVVAVATYAIASASSNAVQSPRAVPYANATFGVGEPTPTAAPTPLVVPARVDGELARGVFTAGGGSPTASSEISDAPHAGVDYGLTAECTSARRGAQMGFELRTADSASTFIEGGSVECNGPPFMMAGPMEGSVPPQVFFTDTDGVIEGYAIVAPVDLG
jgi:hypothetical protein